mgnify:CR=1 FL=1
MNRIFYSLLLYLLVPLILLRLLYRSLKNPEYRRRIPERFGFFKDRPEAGGIWVHAVSVGEAIAAIKLVRALQEQEPETPVTVTCGTPTGSEIIRKQLGARVFHVYVPYDLPGAVNRFLLKTRPAAGIIMETEIWPNLLHTASNRGIRLLISQMRLSDTSFRRYRKFPGLVASSLGCVDRIAAQTAEDAKRANALGAVAAHVEVVGNLKFEMGSEAVQVEQVQELRQDVAKQRGLWIAGSTHQGEDEMILKVHEKLLEADPELLLILVPRHPERFDDVFSLCTRKFKTQRRSALGLRPEPGRETQVLLVDTMGELSQFIRISDWAFIGGSLVPVGGHNVLEASEAEVPVIFGEYMHNFREIAAIVKEEKAGIQVDSEIELLDACRKLANDASYRVEMGGKGRELVVRNRGALQKTLDMLRSMEKEQGG